MFYWNGAPSKSPYLYASSDSDAIFSEGMLAQFVIFDNILIQLYTNKRTETPTINNLNILFIEMTSY